MERVFVKVERHHVFTGGSGQSKGHILEGSPLKVPVGSKHWENIKLCGRVVWCRKVPYPHFYEIQMNVKEMV